MAGDGAVLLSRAVDGFVHLFDSLVSAQFVLVAMPEHMFRAVPKFLVTVRTDVIVDQFCRMEPVSSSDRACDDKLNLFWRGE